MDAAATIKFENNTDITMTTVNVEGNPLLTNEHVIWLSPFTCANGTNNGGGACFLHEVNNGYNTDTATFGDYAALVNSNIWECKRENLMDNSHRTVSITGTEIVPHFSTVEQNCEYPFMLPGIKVDSTENSCYSLGLEEGTTLINVENEDGTPNYLIVPSTAVAYSPSDASSGVSDEHTNSQFSDDTQFSQDDKTDETLCTGIVSSDSEIPECIHHEETVELNNAMVDHSSEFVAATPTVTERMRMRKPIDSNEQPVGNPIYHHIGQHFTNEEINEVLDEVDGPVVQQTEYTDATVYSAQTLQQQQQNHYLCYNLQEYFPNYPALLNRDANNRATSVNQCQSIGMDRKTSTSEIETPVFEAWHSKPIKASPEKQALKPKSVKRPKKNEKNNWQTKRRRKEPVRPRIDVNSFRFKMGPNLRTLSAVLEITGVKHVSDFIPYDVIRRFHPTDMFRTIEKAIHSLTMRMNGGNSGNRVIIEPDWEQLQNQIEPPLWTTLDCTEELDSNLESRIYYKCVGGNRNKHNHISIRKELEQNGRPSYAPDVITAVGSAHLNVTLNLHHVAKKCLNTEFKQSDNVGPMLIRLKNPKCTGILYETGVLYVVGTKSYEQFRMATRKFARMVQKTGADVRLTNLKMHFCIGLVKLPFDINVEAMMQHEVLSKYILFDPTIFSGVIIKMSSSPLLCLVFSTGAVLMTEAVDEREMKTTLDKIYPTLRLFASQS